MQQQQYLTASEVADLFQLNVETVYDLVGNGELPATKVGGRWRFDVAELRCWFKEHRSGSARSVDIASNR